MKYTARTWRRLSPLVSRGIITFISLFLIACENNSPSQIDSPSASAAPLNYDLYGTQLAGGEGRNYKPAVAGSFSVNAGSLVYSDQQLIATLNGQIKRDSSFEVYNAYWAQTSGPEALILNPNSTVTETILPQVDEPTWVSFNLLVIADDLYYAQDTVRIRVLPSSQSLLTVTTSVEEFLDQVTVNIKMNPAVGQAITISYSTEDGSATADEDYVAQSGQFTLDATQDTTALTIGLLNDSAIENNEYFALSFSSDLGGQQKTYVAIIDDESQINLTKPRSLGPVTEPLDNLPGNHADLRALVLTESNQTNLLVTDPCEQQYPGNSEYPACNGRNPAYESGRTEVERWENLIWDAPTPGAYVFSVSNNGQEAAVVNVLVFNGDQSESFVASIPAGTTLEFTRIDVTEVPSQSSVSSSSKPASSSSSSAEGESSDSSISSSSSTSSSPSESSSSSTAPSSSSSSSQAQDLAKLCIQQKIDCSQFQTNQNPYEGTDLYLDPDYQSKVKAYASQIDDQAWLQALTLIEDTSTAIWLDKHSMVLEGDPETGRRSLKQQLQAASDAQSAQAEPMPMAVQIVVSTAPIVIEDQYTEQNYTAEQLQAYSAEVIEPLLKLAQDFPNLRLILVMEPNLAPSLIKMYSKDRPDVQDAKALINDTLVKFSSVPSNNIYTYLGIGHGAWLLREASSLSTLTTEILPINSPKFRGFATNVGSYSPTEEPLFIYNRASLHGFYQDQFSVDELGYLSRVQNILQSGAFERDFNYIIDTSRNGWGGVARPTLEGGMASRIDQRHYQKNWCNIKQAGIGELTKVSPLADYPNIDAFTWIKQPGYSDGASATEGADEVNIDACDPRNEDSRAQAPVGGYWFDDHFTQLVENAWPPLLPTNSALGMPFSSLEFSTVPSDSETANVVLRGMIASDTEIQSVNFYINGVESAELGRRAKLYGAGFDLSISADTFPQVLIQYKSSQTTYDDTKYELTVEAIDNFDVRYEQTVFYSQALNAVGTNGADLIFYRSSNSSLYGYAGNDLFLPIENQNTYASIVAGSGNDTIHLTRGNANGGEGDDSFIIEPNQSRDTLRFTGDLGDDSYYYTMGESDSLDITELAEADGGDDTLYLTNATKEDIKSVEILTSGGRLDLYISFNDGGNIRIRNYLTEEKIFFNTIETIRFSDQSEWNFKDVLRLAFPKEN